MYILDVSSEAYSPGLHGMPAVLDDSVEVASKSELGSGETVDARSCCPETVQHPLGRAVGLS